MRLAEPDLDFMAVWLRTHQHLLSLLASKANFRAFIDTKRLPSSSALQLKRAWEAWQDERYRRGERAEPAAYTDNPYRPC